MPDPALVNNIKKKLLLRSVSVNDSHTYKIYNVVLSGNKYKLYRGNASLIAELSFIELQKFYKGEVLSNKGNVIRLLPREQTM